MYTTGLLVMDVKIGLFRAYPSEDIVCPSPAGLSPSMKSKSFDPEGISESLPLGTWNAIAHEPVITISTALCSSFTIMGDCCPYSDQPER